MQIQRYEKNPIVIPGMYDWRRVATFNPACILEDGTFYMLERACSGLKPLQCRIGLLKSDDGFHFTHVTQQPVFTPEQLGCPAGTIEDPRVTKIDGTYYMIFAHRPFNYNCYPTGIAEPVYTPLIGKMFEGINLTRSGIAVSHNLVDWQFLSWITPPDVDDRDNVLFPEKIGGKYAMLRRPMGYVGEEYGCDGPSVWISYSDDLTNWSEPVLVAAPEQDWEGGKIGAAAPPILTDAGWLTFFHGVDDQVVYRVGVMLLDRDHPETVIARSPEFIMEPQEYYEKVGLIIPNVVFPTAAVVKDGRLYIYYGCADTCIGVATVMLEDMLNYVLQFQK